MPLLILTGLFLLVAAAYSSVGFGGGSTYNALLILSGTDFRLVPSIALTCNILVVSGGVFHYTRAGSLSIGKLLPFIVLSMPMAWLGGRLLVSEQVFIGLLGFSLLVAAAQMLLKPDASFKSKTYTTTRYWLVAAPIGGFIGLLAGITGIGGGIFLAPLLYFFHLASARTVAGITSGFILVNSIAGLSGQLMKAGDYSPLEGWMQAWPLFIAVVIGGQIGSHLGAYHLPENWIKRLTAVLMLYVAVRLIWRWAGLSLG
ncbi:MAG TPA: sulfite exporter TauE/SafE family protein [Xanthomonadales bacterium]